MDWMQFIQNVGFPIAACIALGVYQKYTLDAYNKMVGEVIKFLEGLVEKEVDEDVKRD